MQQPPPPPPPLHGARCSSAALLAASQPRTSTQEPPPPPPRWARAIRRVFIRLSTWRSLHSPRQTRLGGGCTPLGLPLGRGGVHPRVHYASLRCGARVAGGGLLGGGAAPVCPPPPTWRGGRPHLSSSQTDPLGGATEHSHPFKSVPQGAAHGKRPRGQIRGAHPPPPAPQTSGTRVGCVAAPPPSLMGSVAQPLVVGMEGPCRLPERPASPCIAGLCRLSQPPAQWFYGQGNPLAARAHSQVFSHKVFSWGHGDHNHPLPTQAAAGPMGDARGKRVPVSPPPPLKRPRAVAPAGPQGRPWRGNMPPAAGTRAPAPAHQGDSQAPVLSHGKASSRVA